MSGQLRLTQHIRYAPSVLALRDIAPFGRNVIEDGLIKIKVTAIAPFGRNVIYAENVIRNAVLKKMKRKNKN